MHPLLRAASEHRLGVFTALDARRAGYDHGEVRHLCSSGRWVRLRRGIYVPAEVLSEHEERGRRHEVDCLAVLLALDRPTAALSHLTAARLWGLPRRRVATADIRLTDPTHGRTGSGFRVSRGPLEDDEVRSRGPLRLTSPARTLVDVARDGTLEDAVIAMDAALLAGEVSPAELAQAVERVARWPGAAPARRAVALADGRAESPLETLGRLRIVGAGLPTPQLQVEIRAAGRLVAVVDAWFEDAAVAVEFDGQVKYTRPRRDPGRVLWDEKVREDGLRALDIGVARVTAVGVDAGWSRNEAHIRALLSRPGPAVRRFTATPRERGRRRSAG